MNWNRPWLASSLIRAVLLLFIVASVSAAMIFLLFPRTSIPAEFKNSPLLAVLGPALLAALISVFADWLAMRSNRESWRKERIQELGEEHYRQMVEGIADYAIYMLDLDGHIISWNEGAARIKGYSEQEALGRHYSIFYPPEAKKVNLPAKHLQTAREEGRTRSEGWRLRKDGSRFWADLLIVPIEDNHGELIGFTKITRDITRWHETVEALSLNEKRLSEAQRVAHIGSWEYDLHTEELVWSTELYRILGLDPDSFIPTTDRFLEIVHPEDKEGLLQALQKAMDELEDYEIIHRIVRPDGSQRVLRAIGHVELNDQNAPSRLLGINEDITERQQLEQDFLEQSRLYESIVRSQNDLGQGVLLIEENQILFSNTALDEILETRVSALKDTDALIEQLGIGSTSPLALVIRGGIDQDPKSMIGRVTLENDQVKHLEYAATTIGVHNHHHVIVLMRDISRRVQFERELQESRDKLRKSYAYLNRAVEDERARISREIHDELGQHLTSLKMDLSWLASKLTEKTDSMSALVDTTVQDVRRLATEMRPGILDDLGLVAAIEWQANEFHQRTGVACPVQGDLELKVEDNEVATAMFRIFQEALTNIARHANAHAVHVRLLQDGHALKMTVEDDGVGVSDETLFGDNPLSLGLIGMRERAEILGGKAVIMPGATHGTIVEVELPLKPKRSKTEDAN